jgi:phage-related minor tail protein
MEDAIVEFGKTGKLSFKDFLNTVIEELLRSQARRLIAQTFGAIGNSGGGGFLGGIGKLLGFANGGIIPTNGPVVVGERGPEILMGAAGRQVIPNGGIGGGSVTYNINAVDAASFKEMVARDPSFIYAVSMQGARTVPGGR